MNDLISIIVPVFNVEKYLEECLTSIINQTYKNLEIILLNDGSSDNSLNICKKFKAMDNRIRIIDKENSGVSDTRNLGVENSNGKYIMFVDSDDYIDVNMISIMYNTLIENNVDVVRCSNNIVKDKKNLNIEKNPIDICNKIIHKSEFVKIINYLFDINGNKINCYTPLLLMKKEVVPKFDVNIKYMEDNLFYIELLKKSEKFYFINVELYNYRANEVSASKKTNNVKQNIFDMILVIKKMIKDINQMFKDEKLIKKIYINQFYVFISKIDILIKNNRIIDEELYNVCDKEILPFVEFELLNKIKKIEYKLLKNKKYKLFVLVEKLKMILK